MSEYTLGMNCAGESASDVANFLLADLRVHARGNSVLLLECDRLQRGITDSLRESAIAMRRQWENRHALDAMKEES